MQTPNKFVSIAKVISIFGTNGQTNFMFMPLLSHSTLRCNNIDPRRCNEIIVERGTVALKRQAILDIVQHMKCLTCFSEDVSANVHEEKYKAGKLFNAEGCVEWTKHLGKYGGNKLMDLVDTLGCVRKSTCMLEGLEYFVAGSHLLKKKCQTFFWAQIYLKFWIGTKHLFVRCGGTRDIIEALKYEYCTVFYSLKR